MMRKTRLAIFDIDGTIFRSSLVIELIHRLVTKGLFPKIAQKEIAGAYLAWLDRKGSYENYVNRAVEIYLKRIAGKKYAAVSKAAAEVAKEQKNRVYRFTRDLIRRLKAQKYFLLAISGSPEFIVKKYAKAAGFDDFYGTSMALERGRFTGRILDLEPAYQKDKVVRRSLAKNRLAPDFKNSLAVGDTEADMPLFKLVGRPILFNPNASLLKLAKRRGWEAVVERKDVIFQLEKFKALK